MLDLPQRSQCGNRDAFAEAVTSAYETLFGQYQTEQVGHADPDWATGIGCHSVALPLQVAREGGEAHGVASIVKHAIDMGKTSIGRIARVERNGHWIVFFESK